MKPNDNQENLPKGSFLRFVAEVALSRERTGPTTQERENMENLLGHTPSPGAGLTFVPAVDEEGQATHHQQDASVDNPLRMHFG